MTDTAADDFAADIEKMTKIAEVLKQFDSADVQALAYDTLAAKAFGVSPKAADASKKEEVRERVDPSEGVNLDDDGDEPPNGTPEKKTAKKAAKKAGKKPNYSATKDINFAPDDTGSLKAFAAAKNPSTNLEKALVVVYYMRETLARTVSTGDVIAAFNHLGWTNPSDPGNNLQKAGTLGWLNTKKSDAIEVVWDGRNYVESTLPHEAKPKK